MNKTVYLFVGESIKIVDFWNKGVFHLSKGRRCRDQMVVGFMTTYTISAYHH